MSFTYLYCPVLPVPTDTVMENRNYFLFGGQWFASLLAFSKQSDLDPVYHSNLKHVGAD